MKAVAEWFPDREKSVAVGYFNAGTSLGAAIAPPLVVFLSMRFGWQAAFMATGALGFRGPRLVRAVPVAGRSSAHHAAGARADPRRPGDDARVEAPHSRRRHRAALWAIALPRFAGFRVADLQLLDSALSRDRAPHGTQADRDLRVDAARGRPRRHRGRLPVAVSRETVQAAARVVARCRRRARRGADARSRDDRARRVAVHGHRAVLRRRLRAPDDLRTRQHAVGRRVRSRGSRHRERLRRNGRVDRRPRLRCWSARSPTRSAMRRCSRASACSTSSASRCSRC